MTYAYARVSARDQNLTRQLNAFRTFGVPDSNIFADKKSGKDFDRSEYRRLLHKLRASDLVVIQSIDRLGRNYDAIIEEWNRITNKIGADILVLDIRFWIRAPNRRRWSGNLFQTSYCRCFRSLPKTNVSTSVPARQKGFALQKNGACASDGRGGNIRRNSLPSHRTTCKSASPFGKRSKKQTCESKIFTTISAFCATDCAKRTRGNDRSDIHKKERVHRPAPPRSCNTQY